MAEYYAVLSKAVAGLEPSTPEARRAIYDKARNALIGQLKAIDPPLPTAEISRQRLELEEAIRRVERETAGAPGKPATAPPPRAARPDPAPVAAVSVAAAQAAPPPSAAPAARAPSAPPPRPAAPPPRSAPPPNNDVFRRAVQNAERDDELPRVERAPAPPPPPPPPTSRVDSSWADEPMERVPPAAPRETFRPQGYLEQPRDDEPRLAPDYDQDWDHTIPVPAFGDADEELPARGRRGRRARPAEPAEPVAKARRSRLPMIILLVLIVAMLGGIGALIWSQREVVADLAAGFSSGSDSGTAAAPAPAPSAPATQAAADASGKDTGRLLDGGGSDVAETDVRVVSPGSDTAGAQSASVSPAIEPAVSAPATTSAPQRAVLYEEPVDAVAAAAGVVAINASVTWSFVPNGINGPEIVGNVDVPDRSMKLKVSIRRNTDSTLPASHVVEVVVDTPSDFPGGGVRDVPRIVFKPAEDARGQPLIGASARVAPGFFWIALSGVNSDMQNNLALLKDRVWIDLPLVYESGQRAIVTIEKGEAGQQVFQTALSAWQQG